MKAPAKTIRITVLGPDGKPMPGVQIHPSVWTHESFEEKDVVTDQEGRATVDLPRTFYILRIWAWRESHVPRIAFWERDALSAGVHVVPAEFTFALRRGTTIGGFVRNEDGKPIVGAKVEVIRDFEESEDVKGIEDCTSLASGSGARVTDAKGYWSLDNVPEGGATVSVKLDHPEYVRDMAWGGLQTEQGVTMADLRAKTTTIVMRRGTRIVGTVTDVDGKPVPGAVVAWGDNPYFDDGSNEVRTDLKGVYRFPPLPDGPVNITVMAKGWSPMIRNVQVSKALDPCDFRLKPGKTIRIRFFDLSDRPIPRVFVTIKKWRGVEALYNHHHSNVLDTGIPWQADANGVFEWTWAPNDEVTYEFAIERYETLEERALAPCDEDHLVTLVGK